MLPLGQMSSLDLLDAARVGHDGLLLEAADEAVGDPGREEVADEEEIVEDTLAEEDERPEGERRFGERHEGHQVHSAVEQEGQRVR